MLHRKIMQPLKFDSAHNIAEITFQRKENNGKINVLKQLLIKVI